MNREPPGDDPPLGPPRVDACLEMRVPEEKGAGRNSKGLRKRAGLQPASVLVARDLSPPGTPESRVPIFND